MSMVTIIYLLERFCILKIFKMASLVTHFNEEYILCTNRSSEIIVHFVFKCYGDYQHLELSIFTMKKGVHLEEHDHHGSW